MNMLLGCYGIGSGVGYFVYQNVVCAVVMQILVFFLYVSNSLMLIYMKKMRVVMWLCWCDVHKGKISIIS